MLRLAVLALGVAAFAGCEERPVLRRTPRPRPARIEALPAPAGDARRGAALVRQFECNRCHDGTGLDARPRSEHCVQCHRAILAGEALQDLGDVPAETLTVWKSHLRSLDAAPSLVAIGARFRAEWLVRFLLEPEDLRPKLRAMMPRLALDEAQARDIAAFLGAAPGTPSPATLDRSRAADGRRLIEAKGCASCHAFSGVPAIAVAPIAVPVDPAVRADALMLAPDLCFVRERFRPEQLVTWLMHPGELEEGTLMPDFSLSRPEAEAITAYLLAGERGPRPRPEVPRRLPLLDRRVTFAEVDERVFHHECWHCHSDPAFALGSGGPGNTGGFGFPGRGIDLSSRSTINSGFRDAQGRRHSLFAPDANGVPRLVAALLARQSEVAGYPVPGIRGMPLGLPPRSPEDIQLVETWIAQGRPE